MRTVHLQLALSTLNITSSRFFLDSFIYTEHHILYLLVQCSTNIRIHTWNNNFVLVKRKLEQIKTRFINCITQRIYYFQSGILVKNFDKMFMTIFNTVSAKRYCLLKINEIFLEQISTNRDIACRQFKKLKKFHIIILHKKALTSGYYRFRLSF